MKIAHISDTHICLPEPDSSHRLADLQIAVDEICQMDAAPDLVIHTGDIAHNGLPEEYIAALEVMSKLPMPLQVIPGNKDKRNDMGKVFSASLGASHEHEYFQYAIDTLSRRLIFLDTLDEGERLGTLCENRLEHLGEMLGENQSKPATIFMHHPTFDVVAAPDPFQFDSRNTVEKFEQIILANPQVTSIFCGHAHRNAQSMIGETEVNVISAIAIDLRWGDYGEAMRDRPVYAIHDL